jgi:RimJ/RimL family protein N-acetyltransferase
MNEFGQPVGLVVSSWQAPPLPGDAMLTGSACRIEPLSATNHTASLYTANETAADGRAWTYLPYGPFESFEDYHAWVSSAAAGSDPKFYAIVDLKTGRAAGVASLMRMHPEFGTIEVGHIHLSPLLQRTRAATEAMYLLMRYAFDLGYRRYEWKCDALNTASCEAGLRLGFRPEGVHRQARVAKGRNRDTAWFSILDGEWPKRRNEFERWLAPENFDAKGLQRSPLKQRP